ncbi:hypothetical protein FQN57_004400 [Myotisia sp. PD_48]|nr:hypothetical protein FQN57_004400 [Myotisia sp. PD_48]
MPEEQKDLKHSQDFGIGWNNIDDEEKHEKTSAAPYADRGDPFGDEKNAEVKYKTLNWWQCGMIMIAETVSLGILSLPSAMAALGIVPAVIIIIGLGIMATYTGYVLGQFKTAYPHVHNMADAGEVLFGRVGREILGGAQLVFLVFVMGSHVLTFAVMMNTLTENGACSIIFSVVGMVVSLILALPRTMKNVSWMSVSSFISIVAAVFVTMIGVGIEHPGREVEAIVKTDLYRAFLAVTNIVFAYGRPTLYFHIKNIFGPNKTNLSIAGHVAFFGFMSELRDPKDYTKALYLLQSVNTVFYTVTAVVIYRYGGKFVASPALGSAGPVVRKVAYGVAIPTIVIAGVINGHVACKYIYVRIFRGTNKMSQRSLLSIGTWVLLTTILWVLAWIIAEAIPTFNTLLSLITALFASWFTYGLAAPENRRLGVLDSTRRYSIRAVATDMSNLRQTMVQREDSVDSKETACQTPATSGTHPPPKAQTSKESEQQFEELRLRILVLEKELELERARFRHQQSIRNENSLFADPDFKRYAGVDPTSEIGTLITKFEQRTQWIKEAIPLIGTSNYRRWRESIFRASEVAEVSHILTECQLVAPENHPDVILLWNAHNNWLYQYISNSMSQASKYIAMPKNISAYALWKLLETTFAENPAISKPRLYSELKDLCPANSGGQRGYIERLLAIKVELDSAGYYDLSASSYLNLARSKMSKKWSNFITERIDMEQQCNLTSPQEKDPWRRDNRILWNIHELLQSEPEERMK